MLSSLSAKPAARPSLGVVGARSAASGASVVPLPVAARRNRRHERPADSISLRATFGDASGEAGSASDNVHSSSNGHSGNGHGNGNGHGAAAASTSHGSSSMNAAAPPAAAAAGAADAATTPEEAAAAAADRYGWRFDGGGGGGGGSSAGAGRRGARVEDVPINQIRRPLGRTRSNDQEKVAALMASISAIGLQEPIDVLLVDGVYYGFSGCHRFEAHQRLGLTHIRCRVMRASKETLRMHLM